ncbi:2-oxoacid:acceptor oxidoreductase subunit alpha [Halanaerobacter jeridensis]|uniref:2-oxoglutarate ferredoxin oxidoreductase subunit alpha n=1 Tax=Halanaerobacter jeridensis TaxID=706427 RepID=A0A938XVY3_9FIRM|nr:2-oxoacid:acceptor oxidoreductase subunit alpha [Halanaerobacter jeridensis]MBM7556607.1 2-oxoglutarate ferredoxin oxidoreductase subunit alpha [Halanaerobacter jeridensis]
MNLNIVIGGEAGQGLKTLSNILSKTFFKMGFKIYSSKDYMSRVRGGHNFMSIRVGTEELTGPTTDEDILLALNEETIERHQDNVTDDGVIVYDGEIDVDADIVTVDAGDIAKGIGNSKVANTVFVGALLKLLDLDLDIAKKVLKDYFADKGEEIAKVNAEALEQGYEAVNNQFSLPEVDKEEEEMLISGNQAVGLGAVMAGVKFYSAYPMTPSTGIMNYIASKENELGIVVEQAEDEIAAINMAVGASYSGIRAMTGTSGGGFSLMNEGLGLAGITETPLVIAEVQRPGPATGLPTRTGQGDLSFVINASQGEFPLMVMAPRTAEDAFYQTMRAFNLAENYQIPVIILSDTFLADSKKNISELDIEQVEIESGFMSDEEAAEVEDYKRYELTEDGISPLAYPGQLEDDVVLVDSDEHDEYGHIIEDAETRNKMVEKRDAKLQKLASEEITEPEYCGPEEADYVLVSWGSTYGPALEAQELLQEDGAEVGLLSFNDLWPLPTQKIEELAEDDTELIVVENNYTGQFAKLLRTETGINAQHNILKYDGRPFTGAEIYNRIQDEVIK